MGSVLFPKYVDTFQLSFSCLWICTLTLPFSSFVFYPSWVKLCCRGCLPVSWNKPLCRRANLNILKMLAAWLCIPGDFSLGFQLVLRSRSTAQASLTPGFGVNLNTCPCGANLFLFLSEDEYFILLWLSLKLQALVFHSRELCVLIICGLKRDYPPLFFSAFTFTKDFTSEWGSRRIACCCCLGEAVGNPES